MIFKYSTKFLSVQYGPNSQMTPTSIFAVFPLSATAQSTNATCSLFPTTASSSTSAKQVPCLYNVTESSTKIPNPKKVCHDGGTDSADRLIKKTAIQSTGYGNFEHIASQAVCSGGGDGWSADGKVAKTYNGQSAITRYRHITSGKIISEKQFHQAWINFNEQKSKIKPQYTQCVIAKAQGVDLCVPLLDTGLPVF